MSCSNIKALNTPCVVPMIQVPPHEIFKVVSWGGGDQGVSWIRVCHINAIPCEGTDIKHFFSNKFRKSNFFRGIEVGSKIQGSALNEFIKLSSK